MMEPIDAKEKLTELRHDLRSPLTVITGFADLLAHADDLSAEVRKDYARRIADAAEEIRHQLEAADL